MSQILTEHWHYLADQARLEAYERAIAEVVHPNNVVLDLGAGSGILGLLACRAGAKRVYAVDDGPVIELARRICRANGYQDRVVFIKGHSLEVELPEKVDLIIADQVGFGGEHGLLRYFNDARSRLLNPGGILVPAEIDLYLAPVETQRMWSQIIFWESTVAGFDVHPAHTLALNSRYSVALQPDELLAQPSIVAKIDLQSQMQQLFIITTTIAVTRPGYLHGIGGWFVAQLTPSISMTNIPNAQDKINRNAVFFPIENPVAVKAGDEIGIQLHIRWENDIYTWNVEIFSNRLDVDQSNLGTMRHSTWKSMFFSMEDLQRMQPNYVPSLTPQGKAQQLVLSLCDGTKTLPQIKHEVLRQFPSLFHTQNELSVFVSELIQRTTRP